MGRRSSYGAAALTCCLIIVLIYIYKKEPKIDALIQTTSKLMKLEDLNGREESDEMLLTYAKDLLVKPSGRDVPYYMNDPNTKDYSGLNYVQEIHPLLHNKRNGFFVDCGAYDGESGSVSMHFEKDFDWTGLLVDAGPSGIQQIMLKRRKAWFIPTCMSTQNKSMIVMFQESGMQSKIAQSGTAPTGLTVRSLCLPFHTMMNAMGVKKVDLFNLDVEGMELPILKTIDFNRVEIDAMVIEHYNNNETVRKEIKNIMEVNGFKFLKENGYDYIFIHSRVGTSQKV